MQCASVLDFTLEGVDYDSFQTTNELTFNFTNSNVGNIIACNTITEYVSIQVDANPVDYYVIGIDVNAYQQGTGFTINAKSNTGPITDWFYIGIDTITPGNYAFSQFGFEAGNVDLDYNVANSLQLNLASYGNVGDYIDATINGTYTDLSGNIRTLSITIHVIRDM